MEENVALDSKKQRKFVKSIRGIKKLIKKNEKAEPQKKDEEKVEPKKPFSMRIKDGRIGKKKKRKERGLVYLSHIPHGFYEHQMTEYFKQFGVVTNARVIRSKRTGTSKGFAFVEFREPTVGQIVAETMNNYLMGKRLIKAAYIPPEKQKHAFRKHWNTVHNPGSQLRLKMKKAFNADKDEQTELKRARKLLSNLNKNKIKLRELGINYDFFAPVDVPEALLDQIVKQEKEDDTVKEENKPKKVKKSKQEQTEDKKVAENDKAKNVKESNNPKTKKSTKNEKDNKPVAEVIKKGKLVEAKKEKLPVKVDDKQQKNKEKQLKAAGVKPAEEFIKLGEDSGDESDSSYDFDSDEYEKMMQEDNSDLPSGEDESDDESGDDDDDDDVEQDEESDEEEIPPKKVKGKPTPKLVQPVQTRQHAEKQKPQVKQQKPQGKQQQPQAKKQQPQAKQQQPQAKQQQPQAKKQQLQKPQPKKQEQKKSVEAKRKAPQKSAVSPKKPKFEKQNQKPLKKQFKKK